MTKSPADDAVEGRGVVCSHAGWQRACELRDEMDRALRRYDYGRLDDAALGIELLRISLELATESKRLRAPESADGLLHDRIPGASGRLLASMPIVRPAESATPSGGAEALPSGWESITADVFRYAQAFERRRAVVSDCSDDEDAPGWRWINVRGESDVAPTMLQAMCAALGIEIKASGPDSWIATGVGSHGRIDDCARKALEAFHALQQTAPAPAEPPCPVLRAFEADGIVERPDDACACTYRDDGHRDVSRFCALHGASWQTLAEQRSELHEDGTPRAGCPVCSSPELDPRERGR